MCVIGTFPFFILTLYLLSVTPVWGRPDSASWVVRGIYLRGPLADSAKVARVADQLVAAGGECPRFRRQESPRLTCFQDWKLVRQRPDLARCHALRGICGAKEMR